MILIRHGESIGNSSGVIQGRMDFALSELGRRQAQQAAEALRNRSIDGIVSSPLLRARETADVIAAELGLSVTFYDDLMEYDHGEISGLTREEIGERFPAVTTTSAGVGVSAIGMWVEIPGAEGREPFFDRVTAALERTLAMDGSVAVVTHGGFINAACHAALGMNYVSEPHMFRSANCSFTEVSQDRQGRTILRCHNDACHLNVKTTPLEA